MKADETGDSSAWSREQDKAFENALATYPEDSADWWEKIAADVPGKSLEEIKHHYDLLVDDINNIESGCVPLPCYNSSSDGSTSHAGDEGTGKKGGHFGNFNGDSNHGGKASRSDQERRKGIAWTEEEHRFSIIGKGNSCDILCNLSNILAARLGATPMAAFQFCLQFWMTSSLLSDGLAIAGQLHRNRATLTDEQLEVHTISAWKEGKSQQYGEAVRAAQLMFGRPLIWVGPDESLKDVALMILQNKISTVPIIYSTIEESSPLLLHIARLGGILKCYISDISSTYHLVLG